MALFNVAPASIPTGINPRGIATADLNGDGHLDLLIANFGDSNVEIRSGNGHGSFVLGTLRSVYGVNGPDIAIGDLDRDGDLDFVVNNESHDSVLGAVQQRLRHLVHARPAVRGGILSTRRPARRSRR